MNRLEYLSIIVIVIVITLSLVLPLTLDKHTHIGEDKGEDIGDDTPHWVAVGNGSGDNNNSILWSTDGKSWSVSTGDVSFSSGAGSGVTYGTIDNANTPHWVAVGNGSGDNNNILWSADGKSWNVSTGDVSFSSYGTGVAYGTIDNANTPHWVAVGNDNILWSTDGKSWNVSTGASFSSYGHEVAYGTIDNANTPHWVAVGNGSGDNNNILWSTDGKSWSVSTGDVSFSSSVRGVAYGTIDNANTPHWVAVGNGSGDNNNNILWSADGKSWNVSTGASFDSGHGVAYGTTDNTSTPHWVAVGYGSGDNNKILWSSDGKSWNVSTGASFGFSSFGEGATYGTTVDGTPLWVAVGYDNSGNTILWSADGKNWNASTGDVSFSSYGAGVAAS